LAASGPVGFSARTFAERSAWLSPKTKEATKMNDAECGCGTCDEALRKAQFDADGDWPRYLSRFMILCPLCGNKRCPRATHHDNPCSGSNDPGQRGSQYGDNPVRMSSLRLSVPQDGQQ
jgi:hypothetical protein